MYICHHLANALRLQFRSRILHYSFTQLKIIRRINKILKQTKSEIRKISGKNEKNIDSYVVEVKMCNQHTHQIY